MTQEIEIKELRALLEERIAIAKVSSDNENYLIKLSIGEAQKIATLLPKECGTCGGSKRVEDRYLRNAVNNGTLGTVEPTSYYKRCPDCPPEPKDDLGMTEQEFMPEIKCKSCEEKGLVNKDGSCEHISIMYEPESQELAEMTNAGYKECWLIHPIDDVDCHQCPRLAECQKYRLNQKPGHVRPEGYVEPQSQEYGPSELREQLADLCHKQWSGWMDYLFGKCIEYKSGNIQAEDGALIIPKWAVERWKGQVNTNYNILSTEEKDSDRAEADKFLALLKPESQELADKYKHKNGCKPKPWENECECGVLQRAKEPVKLPCPDPEGCKWFKLANEPAKDTRIASTHRISDLLAEKSDSLEAESKRADELADGIETMNNEWVTIRRRLEAQLQEAEGEINILTSRMKTERDYGTAQAKKNIKLKAHLHKKGEALNTANEKSNRRLIALNIARGYIGKRDCTAIAIQGDIDQAQSGDKNKERR